jgi:hypothetical protein
VEDQEQFLQHKPHIQGVVGDSAVAVKLAEAGDPGCVLPPGEADQFGLEVGVEPCRQAERAACSIA